MMWKYAWILKQVYFASIGVIFNLTKYLRLYGNILEIFYKIINLINWDNIQSELLLLIFLF